MTSRELAAFYEGFEYTSYDKVTFGDVLLAYRSWAGWHCWNEEYEKETKARWVRYVLYHRQEQRKKAA